MSGTNIDKYILFTLDGQQHALRLSSVERIIRAVSITPLPGKLAPVLGVVNVQVGLFLL